MEYIDDQHPEWETMWAELRAFPINDEDELCIHQGKCWEYLGSTQDHHHFMHALHPTTGRSEFVYIERYRQAVGWD